MRWNWALAFLILMGITFQRMSPKGGRHGDGILRALRKKHLVIPVLEVEDAEDPLPLLLLQQVGDEGQ